MKQKSLFMVLSEYGNFHLKALKAALKALIRLIWKLSLSCLRNHQEIIQFSLLWDARHKNVSVAAWRHSVRNMFLCRPIDELFLEFSSSFFFFDIVNFFVAIIQWHLLKLFLSFLDMIFLHKCGVFLLKWLFGCHYMYILATSQGASRHLLLLW